MRVDALVQLPAKADFWDFITSQSPVDGELSQEYHFKKQVKLMFSDTEGILSVFCRDLLPFNGQLRNIVDKAGVVVLDVTGPERIMYLGTPVAQFDVYGNVIGYKYTLTINGKRVR